MSTLQIPVGPFFVPRHKFETGGVDFLGLRQTNLDLMQRCLPGISNTTEHIRCYSIPCWIYWQFHRLAGEEGVEEVDSKSLRIFREKIETLFTWGHKIHGVQGVPGRLANPPKSRTGKVPLDFKSWSREGTNTSLMAAVQYGPSLKTTIGLGFLEPVGRDFFRVRGQGVELAEALGGRLQAARGKAFLSSLEAARATEADALGLFEHWDIRSLDRKERRAFRKVLYDSEAIVRDSDLGRRSATMTLVREVLAQAGRALEVAEIRERMTLLSGLARLRTDPALGPAWCRWLVMQVRQIQRLGLEGLLRWVQHRVIESDEHDIGSMLAGADRLLRGSAERFRTEQSVAKASSRVLGDVGTLEEWLREAKDNPAVSLLGCSQAFERAAKSDPDELPSISLRLLLLTASLTDFAVQLPGARPLLSAGQEPRIALARWAAIVRDHREDTLASFLRRVLENEVLSQHFAVAAGRFDGGVQRLQLAIEEEGLVALNRKPATPFLTRDRLQAALSLMSECGLVQPEGEGAFGPSDF